jgi:hypothetical protein
VAPALPAGRVAPERVEVRVAREDRRLRRVGGGPDFRVVPPITSLARLPSFPLFPSAARQPLRFFFSSSSAHSSSVSFTSPSAAPSIAARSLSLAIDSAATRT